MRISDWSSDVCSSDLAAIAAEANGKHRLILRRKIEEDRGEAGRKRPDRRIDHRARQPKLEFAGIAAPGMRVDVIQNDAPGGAHTGEFARPETAVRVPGRQSAERRGGKEGVSTGGFRG